MHRKRKISDYTFQRTTNLFNEEVVMVLRNKDKKHIVSLTEKHRKEMIEYGLNPDDNKQVLVFLNDYNYL